MALLACSDNPVMEPAPVALANDHLSAWRFRDVTRAAGLDFRYTFGDDQFSFILEDTGSGCAVLDFDADDYLDIYLLNGCYWPGVSDPAFAEKNTGTRNRLYRNRGDGTFEDVSKSAAVDSVDYSMGAVVGDYDADGHEDLYVLNYGPNRLYRNEGDGTFKDVTEQAGVAGPERLNGMLKWSVNGAFFDADGDLDLDLYVANYLAFDPEFVDPELPPEYPYPGPESYAGQASLLFRNDGKGTFTEVRMTSGLENPGGKTMGASIADFDNDGDLDIFEALDDMANVMFRNEGGGEFQQLGPETGLLGNAAGESMASMHGSIGDFDENGLLDLFVPDLAHGCLYRNLGGLKFLEVSAQEGVARVLQGSGGWGSHFEDFDNDSHLDLLVVLGGAFDLDAAEADRLLHNQGDGSFADVSATLGPYFESTNVSRGAAFADFDNDGDLDFVVSRKDVAGDIHLVRNDLPSGNHWLTLDLEGLAPNRDAIGARVELTLGERVLVREVGRCGSYLSQNDPRPHFGLGLADRVDAVNIRWPSGRWSDVEVTQVDTLLKVRETP
jgi:hypothetical protein